MIEQQPNESPKLRLPWPELPGDTPGDQTDEVVFAADENRDSRVISRRVLLLGSGILALAGAGLEVRHLVQVNTAVPNTVRELPPTDVPNILEETPGTVVITTPSPAPSTLGETVPSDSLAAPTPTSSATTTHPLAPVTRSRTTVSHTTAKPTLVTEHAKEAKKSLPELAASIPKKLVIPKLGINTAILPVDTPIIPGAKNAMGGPEYERIDFPVDAYARYWVEGGLPNTIRQPNPATQQKDMLRTIIYGHASDIGNHLLFQDLQNLHIGDKVTVETDTATFTYTVYLESNPAKSGLADDSQVYGYPAKGRKELALVACLPDSSSHSVRIAYLSAVS
jgi:hypothetical protein